MPRLTPWALALCLGCSGAPAAQSRDESSSENGAGDEHAGGGDEHAGGSSPTPLAGGRCPTLASELPDCSAFSGDWCTRDDGAVCRCESPHWCGGAAPPPMPRSWICSVPEPRCPEPGTPCTGTGSCSRGRCRWENVVQCVNGTWQPVYIAPPP
jgi:hypothetical protein